MPDYARLHHLTFLMLMQLRKLAFLVMDGMMQHCIEQKGGFILLGARPIHIQGCTRLIVLMRSSGEWGSRVVKLSPVS